MVLGMSLEMFTFVHTIISLVAIALGFAAMGGMMSSNRLPAVTAWFLVLTIVTSATGFFFPFTVLLPSLIVGILSLVLLAIAVVALYFFKLAGGWRWIYVATALVALYLNVFVLIVQMFAKFPAFITLAPTQSEPPFLVVQGGVLIVFALCIVAAVRRFRPVGRSISP